MARKNQEDVARTTQPVFLEVQWDYDEGPVFERIGLDLPALAVHPEQTIATIEYWSEPVHYRPRAKYSRLRNGDHRLEMHYKKKDHPELDGMECIWGKTCFVISSDLSHATAHWTSVPAGFGINEETPCKVFVPAPATLRDAIRTVRTAQAHFKQKVLRHGKRCAITGERILAALDAAHVQDVADGGPDIAENGILLRADLHRLFDDGYFTIRANGTVKPHDGLSPEYKQLLATASISKETLARIAPYLKRRKVRQPTGAQIK